MLVYMNKRVYPKAINIIILEAGEGYLYAHKSTYDQALILSVKQNFESLLTLLDCGDQNAEAIVFAAENLPSPLNMLAPFLGLITEEIPADIEKIAGAINVICTSISPYNFIKKPKDIRKTLEFSGSILNEYQDAWKAFELQCVSEDMVTLGVPFPVYNQMGVYPSAPTVATAGHSSGRFEVPPADYIGDPLTSHHAFTSDTPEVPADAEVGEEFDITLEQLKADPAWEDCGDGIWFNNQTGAAITIDDGTTDEEFEAEFEAMVAAEKEIIEEDEQPVQQVKPGGSVQSLKERLALKKG